MDTLKTFINTISPIKETTWEKVSLLFTETTLCKNDYFIKEGEKASKMAFLQAGVMRAFYRNKEGTEYNKHFFTAPCMAGGFSSLITGNINAINLQALTECKLLVASYAGFCKLYDHCPDLERVGRRLAEFYFVEKEKREIDIVLLDAEKRYQIFLREYPGLFRLIAQYHIASYLGITPTQLSRIRRSLAAKK